MRKVTVDSQYAYTACSMAGICVLEYLPTGIGEDGWRPSLEQGAAALIPNPTRGVVRLAGGVAGDVALQVFDATGQAVTSEAVLQRRTNGGQGLDLTGLPAGLYGLAGTLLIIGTLHFLTAWPLNTTAEEALTAAAREVSFPVGHASAAATFEGWRSRPVWQVLVYSADDPPTSRGLVRVDGVDGAVAGKVHEEQLRTKN